MNFHFRTLGCKVNQYETQAMKEAIIKLGHTADESSDADAVIINSLIAVPRKKRQANYLLN